MADQEKSNQKIPEPSEEARVRDENGELLLSTPKSRHQLLHGNDRIGYKKLPKGLHIGISNDPSRFLWEGTDPLSPPESSSRSISFSQLRNNHRNRRGYNKPLPRMFINEDDELYFNDGRFPSLHSPKANHDINSLPFVRSDEDDESYSSDTNQSQNFAARTIDDFDYNIGIRSEWKLSSGIHSLYLFSLRLFKKYCNNRKVCILFAVLAGITATAPAWQRTRQEADNLTTQLVTDEAIEIKVRSQTVQEQIIKRNITSEYIFENQASPQLSALTWVAQHDPMKADPESDEIIERYALAVFYFSAISDSSSIIATDWLTDKGICNWTGVICDTSINSQSPKVSGFQFLRSDGPLNGKLVGELFTTFKDIQMIQATGVNLKGSIPSEIGLLSSIKVLSIGENFLSGSLPSEIGKLSKLQLLGLYENDFNSNLPIEIGTLTRLSALYIDNNDFTGHFPPIQNLARLLDFRFGGNRLDGTLPKTIGELRKLQILDFENNLFTGPIPYELASLRNLRFLQASHNMLNSTINLNWGNLKHLWYLNLSSNMFTGEIPNNEFAVMESLKNLILTGNASLHGKISDELCKLVMKGLELEVDLDNLNCECCAT